MAKTYILQKNLPDSLKGAKYIWNSFNGYCLESNVTGTRYSSYIVENNPEWFLEYSPKTYTEDDMRKCFYAPIHDERGRRFDLFEDYLKTL